MTRVVRLVGAGQVFTNRRGGRVGKFSFEVEVERATPVGGPPSVNVDPDEHAGYLWVTEEECRSHRVDSSGAEGSGDVFTLDITSKDQEQIILEGFRLRSGKEPLLKEPLGSVPWE